MQNQSVTPERGVTHVVEFFYLAPVLAALSMNTEVHSHDVLEPSGDLKQFNHLKFYVSRIAMDGAGGIVGDEMYSATVRLLDREQLGMVYGVPVQAEPFLIFPELVSVELFDSPEAPEYTIDNAREFLTDDADWQKIKDADGEAAMSEHEIMQLAYDKGLGEGDYYPPSADFIHEHVGQIWDRVLEAARNCPITWDAEGGVWMCEDETLWEPNK